MLKLKDLKNRVYDGKTCIRFEVELPIEENPKRILRAEFEKQDASVTTWRMKIMFDRTSERDSQTYFVMYVMPKEGMPLEMIAATGLAYFQRCLKSEIQEKINIDFWIGENI